MYGGRLWISKIWSTFTPEAEVVQEEKSDGKSC